LTRTQFSDAARLLSFYQLWLDDLFPKAKFLDALAMVEKTGHKTTVLARRKEWIAEERRKERGVDATPQVEEVEAVESFTQGGSSGPDQLERAQNSADVEDDLGDIYGATPPRALGPASPRDPDGPDDDETLEALMMEAGGGVVQTSEATDPKPQENDFADEEAALAEMEGLW
jgi:replication fork protection complex subunit Csm3/Swi3